MQAFASLSVSELQVHLPLLLMWPVSKLQHIESNPAHTSNLAPIVAASDDEADLRKDSKTLDKQAKQQIKQERAQREKKETEELVQDPQFRLPEEYTKMPIEPEPVHIVNARKAKLGVDLAEKEDESTDTDHDSDLETFLTDHPKDKEKLAQMQQSPVEPVTLLGERGHPHDQTLPEYLEPGTEVDEEPDASPVHTDKQKTHTCEFVDDAAEESENEETIDPSFFFYAVPTGSTTGKQQLMMMEEDGTCRLATAEERAYYHSLETDSDDD